MLILILMLIASTFLVVPSDDVVMQSEPSSADTGPVPDSEVCGLLKEHEIREFTQLLVSIH
jgi:hypothetical protein